MDKTSADECWEDRQLAVALMLHNPFLFLTLSPIFSTTFPIVLALLTPSHITPIFHSLPHSVFSESHFLSHHLCPWLERLVLTVFIIPCLSSFDQEDSSQDLARCCSQSSQTYLNSQKRMSLIYILYTDIFIIQIGPVFWTKLGETIMRISEGPQPLLQSNKGDKCPTLAIK